MTVLQCVRVAGIVLAIMLALPATVLAGQTSEDNRHRAEELVRKFGDTPPDSATFETLSELDQRVLID